MNNFNSDNAITENCVQPQQSALSAATKSLIAESILKDLGSSAEGPVSSNMLKDLVEDSMRSVYGELVQKLLDMEMTLHLGAERYGRISAEEAPVDLLGDRTPNKRNYRNGTYERKIKSSMGEFTVKMPRDRNSTFDPVTVPKHLGAEPAVLREEILKLASMGNSVRDIQSTVQSLLNVDVNNTYVQAVIDSFQKEYDEWQQSKIDPFYPFLFVDCLYANVRNEHGIAQNKPVYVILGINTEGKRTILDISMSTKSSAETKTFWLNRFDRLKQRGLVDVMFVSMDGVSGLEAGVKSLFPEAQVQRCVVHLVRNSLTFVEKSSRDKWCSSVKAIYTAMNEDEAYSALENFKQKWSETHSAGVSFIEERFMTHIMPLFELPSDIRKIIYTTNSIEAVNSSLRKVTKKGIFGSEKSVVSKMYLRVSMHLDEKWSERKLPGWTKVMNQLMICEKTRALMLKHVPCLANKF